jgi:spermidine/putrescine transport system permease protein
MYLPSSLNGTSNGRCSMERVKMPLPTLSLGTRLLMVLLSVMPRLKKMNQNVYEAALDLGATPFQALRKVILPEILPGMISGFILAFTLSIDDFAVTIFTIGNEGLETLSTYIYADARKGGLTPELRPLSTLIFITVLVLLIVINKRAERARKK